jgi:hypothetical protein
MYFPVVVLCVHVKYSWRLSGEFLGKKNNLYNFKCTLKGVSSENKGGQK